MDAITSSALEEICASGSSGIPLAALWRKISNSIAAAGLDLCPGVKSAVWSSLLAVPSLHYVGQPNVQYRGGDDAVQRLEDAEGLKLNVVADDHLRNSFVGLYDLRAAEAGISPVQRRALELLGSARTSGITQSELAKIFNKNGNNMFFVVKNLEYQGLVTRHSTIVRTKDVENEYSSTVSTNMIYLSRYSKHLGFQHKLEVRKEDSHFDNPEFINESPLTGGSDAGECAEEEVHINDTLPALKAICDKLEAAKDKVLLISDIKKDLGYRNTPGHRRWRNVCKMLEDAGVVEEFLAIMDKKENRCLRLLQKFSPKFFGKRNSAFRNDSFEDHLVNFGHKDKVNHQLVELPIEHQIYDMIDAEGPTGITFIEICRKLGINNKKNYSRLLKMFQRFGVHLQPEECNRGKGYRVWTSRNFSNKASSAFPNMSKHLHSNDCLGNLQVTTQSGQSISLLNASTTKGNENVEEANNKKAEREISYDRSADAECGKRLLPSSSSQEAMSEQKVPEPCALAMVNVTDKLNNALVETSSTALVEASSDLMETSPSALSKPSRPRFFKLYPCLTLTALTVQRRQKIRERLQDEEFILRAELHRWLESLDPDKSTGMDRKTLDRLLDDLQVDGLCKLTSTSVPVATNYHSSRTAQVVLHPSIQGLSPELTGRIHDRMRSFDMQIRHEGSCRVKKKLSVSVLNDVQRISNPVKPDYTSLKFEAMRSNGYVIAKMMRAKLFHCFLWGYLNNRAGIDEDLSARDYGRDMGNPHSTCKQFVLESAIKAIPLELFLQVVGSSHQFDDIIEKCRGNYLISDLPMQEYRHLMDTYATGRISWILDILRRLKLVRVVANEHSESRTMSPHGTLTHALELRPYIEEPLSIVAASSNFISIDLRPWKRHDFILSNKKAVDIYWKTLEYCYAAADPAAALHAFPGSSVHEVFGKRSWSSIRVMTVEQRSELLRRISNDDPGKNISFQQCEEIARDLNLSLQQVLRFYNEKRQRRMGRYQKGKMRTLESEPQENGPPLPSRKRRRTLDRLSLENVEVDAGAVPANIKCEERLSQPSGVSEQGNLRQFPDEFNSSLESHDVSDHIEERKRPSSPDDEEASHSFMKPPRQKRFLWTEESDRQLIIKYVKHRAIFGAKSHGVNWNSIEDLPAPQSCCRRRIGLLRRCLNFRKSVNRLCTVLSGRYAKHLNKARRIPNGKESKFLAQGVLEKVNFNGGVENTERADFEDESWDSFENESTKTALNEVLRHKRMAKLGASKRSGLVPDKWSDLSMDAEECELNGNHLVSSGTPSENIQDPGGKFSCSRRNLSRRCPPPKLGELMNGRTDADRQTYESLAVSNAVELFKLVFLNASTAPEAPNMLAETLRRYSEHDLFTAFNFLKEKNIMVAGNGSHPFVLSQQFLQNVSSSPFLSNTGERALKFASWLCEREEDMIVEGKGIETGISLYADLQCGDIFQLFALVSSGILSISPQLPAEGFGEAEDSRIVKRKADDDEFYREDSSKRMKPSLAIEGELTSRKAKGFPGITVSLRRKTVSAGHSDMSSGFWKMCRGSVPDIENDPLHTAHDRENVQNDFSELVKELLDAESTVHVTTDPDELSWVTMTCYAKCYKSTHSDCEQGNHFYPELFQTVYEAIQRSGDQGLCIKEVPQNVGLSGEVSEIVIEVLEAFRRVLKVNAYDSERVVDALYLSKYFLTSAAANSQHHSSVPSVRTLSKSAHDQFIHQHRSNLQAEVNINMDNLHRVTILNRPEEASQPSNEINCSEGLAQPFDDLKVNKDVQGSIEGKIPRTFTLSSTDCPVRKPILPWINGDGTVNHVVYKGLTRRAFGTVMQNPGILEAHIIQRMNVLNPQSCRRLLDLMIMDNQLIVREMHQTTSDSPPSLLGSLIGSSFKKSKSVFRKHFFANSLSASLL